MKGMLKPPAKAKGEISRSFKMLGLLIFEQNTQLSCIAIIKSIVEDFLMIRPKMLKTQDIATIVYESFSKIFDEMGYFFFYSIEV